MSQTLRGQDEALGLLRAAVHSGHVGHAYLFHGPRGVGKRRAALAFAGTLLGDPDRVSRHAHPDLYVLEPLGDQIRIDPVRELRRDLHMRPFEASRRVYLVFGAHTMNEDAADALLKDLEEPPDYAVLVLVADDDFKLNALWEIVSTRLVRRNVPVKNLTRGAALPAANSTVRQDIALQQGIPSEKAKDIVKFLKDAKLKKVQASIQGDQLRVTSPSKDDLQEAMRLLREQDFGVALQFGNYRG